jgi:hypothetical protein
MTKINCCVTVHHSRKNMPHNFEPKVLKMKKRDIVFWTPGDLRVVCWKEKQKVYVLTKINDPPAEGKTSQANLEIM